MKGLFEEFMPQEEEELIKEGSFAQDDVWRRAGAAAAGNAAGNALSLTTPPNVSPKSRHAQPSLAEREKKPMYRGIPLERITPPASPTSNPPESSEYSETDSDSDMVYSDEESESAPKPRSKFVSFVEPDMSSLKLNLSATRRHSSFSSQEEDEGSSPVTEKKQSGETSPIAITNTNPSMSGSVSLPNSASKRNNLSKMAFTPRQHQHQHQHHPHHPHLLVSSSDWPDPYGIIPDQVLTSGTMTGVTSTPGTSRTSTQSSPAPAFGRNTKEFPRAGTTGLAGHEIGSGVVEAPLAGRGSTEVGVVLVDGSGPVKGGVTSRVGSGQGKEMRGREEKFEKKEWEEYRKRRVETLITWWDGCVENVRQLLFFFLFFLCLSNLPEAKTANIQGEMQLATTIALIASSLVTFPPFQLERLAHAYVELLERHRLPIFAAYIRRFSGIPSLEITPQDEGLTHTYFCEKCGKSTGSLEDIEVKGKIFWWCKKCRAGARGCAVWYVRLKWTIMRARRFC